MSSARAFRMNPDRIAHYEAAGWRAYYDRQWARLLALVVGLGHEQFHIPFPVSLLAAYHITRASIAWVPADHDLAVVRSYYEKFYRLARRYSGLDFDPARAGALETQYNEDHRRLVGQSDKAPFVETMVQLHATLFGLAPGQALESAQLRVLACNTVDLITGHISTDVEGDWARLEEYLRRCYASIQLQLEAGPQLQPAAQSQTN